jgi:thermitase
VVGAGRPGAELSCSGWGPIARIEYAEPNYYYYTFAVPNDTHFGKQWAHTLIKSPQAWEITTGDPAVKIAILDTGIDLNHPDLRDKIVAGWDFVQSDSMPQDANGHGTHVAGIAAAMTDNGLGIAGLDWQARLMPVRVLGDDGSGDLSHIAAGIRWAYQQGARVINLSLGSKFDSTTLRNAVNEATNAGSLVVAAMGNSRDRGNLTMYPAALPNVLAVSATGPNDASIPSTRNTAPTTMWLPPGVR